MTDIVAKLKSPATIFYEYAADKGELLREAAETIEALRAENAKLRAHISEMHSVIEWMVALIDGGEEMPKPGDEIHDDLSLCLINTKEFSARAARGDANDN